MIYLRIKLKARLKGSWVCINGHVVSTDPYRSPINCNKCGTSLVKLEFEN